MSDTKFPTRPIPLHKYRAFKRSKADKRADRIHVLAKQLSLPISALTGSDVLIAPSETEAMIPHQPFDAHVLEYQFPNSIAAKLAIADELAVPLTKLSSEDRAFIDRVLSESMIRSTIIAQIRNYFRPNKNLRADYAD